MKERISNKNTKFNSEEKLEIDRIKRMQDIPVAVGTVLDLLKSSPTVDYYIEKIVWILEFQAMTYRAMRREAKRGELLIDWDIIYDKELFSKYYDLNSARADEYGNLWYGVKKELIEK